MSFHSQVQCPSFFINLMQPCQLSWMVILVQIINHETILSIHETTINCGLIGLNIDAKFILKKLIFLAPTGAQEMLVFIHPSSANLSRSLNLHLSGLDLRVFKRVFKRTSSGPNSWTKENYFKTDFLSEERFIWSDLLKSS